MVIQLDGLLRVPCLQREGTGVALMANGMRRFFGITCSESCRAMAHWGAWMDHKIDARCKGTPTVWWLTEDGRVFS